LFVHSFTKNSHGFKHVVHVADVRHFFTLQIQLEYGIQIIPGCKLFHELERFVDFDVKRSIIRKIFTKFEVIRDFRFFDLVSNCN